MTRQEILKHKDFKFSATELVCKHAYERFGEKALEFLDVRLLETLLWIRQTLGKPMTINHKGANQRGLRCNLCPMVKSKIKAYLSAHVFGQGVDFDVQGMKATEVRDWLAEHANELPHKIRLEIGEHVTWVHLDVRNETPHKIVYFQAS